MPRTEGDIESYNFDGCQIVLRQAKGKGKASKTVAVASGGNNYEDAGYIVKCWNNHDKLVKALSNMTALCRLKYGNSEEDVYSLILEAEQLLQENDTVKS